MITDTTVVFKKGDSALLSVRAPRDLIDTADKYAAERGMSRSQCVIESLRFMLSSIECINCHNDNPAEGKRCAVCNFPLYSDEAIKEAIIEIFRNKVYESPDSFPDIEKLTRNGLNSRFIPVIDRTKNITEYFGEIHVFTEDGIELVPVDGSYKMPVSSDLLIKYLSIIEEQKSLKTKIPITKPDKKE